MHSPASKSREKKVASHEKTKDFEDGDKTSFEPACVCVCMTPLPEKKHKIGTTSTRGKKKIIIVKKTHGLVKYA